MTGASITTPKKFLGGELNVNSLRTNDLLRKDEWKELDEAVVQIARRRLNGIADLQDRGLTLSLGGLGTLISQYEAVSDLADAELNMAGVTPGERASQEFNIRNVPIPIIHKDFQINIRRLEASRKLGDTIDTTQADTASRKVADKNEDLLFNGAGITVDGDTIYGYTTMPQRQTSSNLQDWSSIANIHEDVLSMVEDMYDVHFYGPFVLYVSANRWTDLLQVYDDGSGQTALERVQNIPDIEEVKPADALDDDNVLLIQMTRDVVDLAIAQDITTIEWEGHGGMLVNFKVMNALAPRIKYDYDGNCGIVHYYT